MSHTVTLRSPDGREETFDCPEDQYVIDAAEENGIDISRIVWDLERTHYYYENIYSI